MGFAWCISAFILADLLLQQKVNTCLYVLTVSFVKPENAHNVPYSYTVKDSLANQVLIEYTQNAYEDITKSEVKKRRAKFDQQYEKLLSE